VESYLLCKRISACLLQGKQREKEPHKIVSSGLALLQTLSTLHQFYSCLVQAGSDALENQAAALEGEHISVWTPSWKSQSHIKNLNSARFSLDIGALANVNYEAGSSHRVKGRKGICR